MYVYKHGNYSWPIYWVVGFHKGTFNGYVTLKGGTGGNPFCYGALLEGEGVQVIPLRNADKISQLVFI